MSMCVFFCFAVENLSFESVLNLDDATVLNFSPNYSIKSTTIYTILMHLFLIFLNSVFNSIPRSALILTQNTSLTNAHMHAHTHTHTHSHTHMHTITIHFPAFITT